MDIRVSGTWRSGHEKMVELDKRRNEYQLSDAEWILYTS